VDLICTDDTDQVRAPVQPLLDHVDVPRCRINALAHEELPLPTLTAKARHQVGSVVGKLLEDERRRPRRNNSQSMRH